MRIIANENVSATVIHELRSRGHDVVSVKGAIYDLQVASSTILISSSVRPYNSYTSGSIYASVAAEAIPSPLAFERQEW